jgi:hypothetical protein
VEEKLGLLRLGKKRRTEQFLGAVASKAPKNITCMFTKERVIPATMTTSSIIKAVVLFIFYFILSVAK